MRISDWSSDVCSSDLGGELESMDAAGQLGGEDFVDPALAGNAALPGEGGRYHLDAEMGLAAFAVAGMALVFFRIINDRSEEHTSELQSLMRISYAVFCLKTK